MHKIRTKHSQIMSQTRHIYLKTEQVDEIDHGPRMDGQKVCFQSTTSTGIHFIRYFLGQKLS